MSTMDEIEAELKGGYRAFVDWEAFIKDAKVQQERLAALCKAIRAYEAWGEIQSCRNGTRTLPD